MQNVTAPADSRWRSAAGLAAASIRAAADTYPRQPGVDAQHYAFNLTLLTSDSNEIAGDATVRLRVVTPETREAVLDFATPTRRRQGDDGHGRHVDGPSGRRSRTPTTACTCRCNGAKAGEDVTYTIAYHGAPANGLRLIDNIHGERVAFSENWYNQARQWLPVIDHIADKASGEFIVTTRADYQVIGNGALVEETDLPGGLRRTHYGQDEPIAPWLYALGVARFVVRHGPVVRGVPLSFWTFPQDEEKGQAALQRDARGAFEFFSDRVGPFAYDKLAHVEAAGMGGGMESATNIFYGEKGVSAGNAPVVHETAHQWFGNSVTESDWNDVWLSEGFATYFTLLYTEHAAGRDAFVEGLRRSRDTVLRVEQVTAEHAGRPRQFQRVRPDGPEHPARVSEGQLGAAHAARPHRHRRVLARHPRLLPRPHERPGEHATTSAMRWRRRRDRTSGVLLHAVADAQRRAGDRGFVAI